MLAFTPRRLIVTLAAVIAPVFLNGCLPGEGDVAERYNIINQQAAVRNAGVSLAQAANNHLAYVKAENLRRKVVMEKVFTSFVSAIPSNPAPTPPTGVKVKICGNIQHVMAGGAAPAGPVGYGAISYFTAQPNGMANLNLTGEGMAAALGERYGADAVGMNSINGVVLPKKALELAPPSGDDCKPDGDILAGSPIFVVGFLYVDAVLPDQGKSLDAEFKRDITIPCTAPLTGVIKREQVCKLKSDDDETEQEDATVKLGELSKGLVDNDVQRLDKKWECVPDLLAIPPPPTAAEEAIYCRDPRLDITKPADNTISMTARNMKDVLETGNNAATYRYLCKNDGAGGCLTNNNVGGGVDPNTGLCRNGGGPPPCPTVTSCPNGGTPPNCIPTSCTTPPCCPSGTTGTPPNCVPEPPRCVKTTYCEPDPLPAQFVANPSVPMTLNPAGSLTGSWVGTQSCGRGWTGTLIARYEVRRCLLKEKCGSVITDLGVKQNIWHLAWAGALCETTVSYRTQCPVGNRTKTIPITRYLQMVKPVALDWHPPAIAGTTSLSSDVATNDSSLLIKTEAAANHYIVPDLRQADLNAVLTDQTQWSLAVANGMKKRDASSITMNVTHCDNTGDPCAAAPSNNITILIDDSSGNPLQGYPGKTISYPVLACSKPSDKCHILLGTTQNSCDGGRGTCDFTGTRKTISGSNFRELLQNYLTDIVNVDLPAGVSFNIQPVSGSIPFFNQPSSVCNFAGLNSPRTILFGFYDIANDNAGNLTCNNLANIYPSMAAMSVDAINTYDQKYDLRLYTDAAGGATPITSGVPLTTASRIDPNIFDPRGELSQTFSSWMTTPLVAQDPCPLIN